MAQVRSAKHVVVVEGFAGSPMRARFATAKSVSPRQLPYLRIKALERIPGVHSEMFPNRQMAPRGDKAVVRNPGRARMPLLVRVQIKQGFAINYTQITTASVTPESISSSSFAMARFRR
jgi:hypothetical protein